MKEEIITEDHHEGISIEDLHLINHSKKFNVYQIIKF